MSGVHGSQPLRVSPPFPQRSRVRPCSIASGVVAGPPPGRPEGRLRANAANAWFDAPDLPAQKQVGISIPHQLFPDLPSIPLGHDLSDTAYRRGQTWPARTCFVHRRAVSNWVHALPSKEDRRLSRTGCG